MPKKGVSYKITKTTVKKAIKGVERPTYSEIAKALHVSHVTVINFLQREKNKDLLELLEERRGNIDILATNLIEDKLIEYKDEKLALKWLDYKKRLEGNKLENSD